MGIEVFKLYVTDGLPIGAVMAKKAVQHELTVVFTHPESHRVIMGDDDPAETNLTKLLTVS